MIECGGVNYQPLVKAASQLEGPSLGIFLANLSRRLIGLRSRRADIGPLVAFRGYHP